MSWRRPPEFVIAASTPGYFARIASATRLPIADSLRRVGSRWMSTVCVPITWLRSSAVSAFALVDDRLDVGPRRDADVLGHARRRADPGDVAVLDHQLGDGVAAARVDALDHRDVPDHRVRDPVRVARDHEVDGRVLQPCDDLHDRALPRRRGAGRRSRWRRATAPSWMTTIWTLTPNAAQPLRLRRMRSASSRNAQALGGAGVHELGRRLDRRADDADAHAVDAEDLRRP